MLAFQHVLDEDAAFGDLLVDDELFIIRSDEENHYSSELSVGREQMWMEKKRGETGERRV